jgi:hydroxymethylpyrimidine pyrophosphatase-like HAD family hydrolase
MNPTMLCLDFDGTILRYEAPPEHIHPGVAAALNDLGDAGVEWIANSGRTLEGQIEILRHTARAYGLRRWPSAILHGECFIHLMDNGRYVPLDDWNARAEADMRAVQRILQDDCREELDRIVDAHAPAQARFLEMATVFQLGGGEARQHAFIVDLLALLASVPEAQLIQNGEWISILHQNVGKGHLLRAYMAHRRISPRLAAAMGDHANDISMLDGSVTPHVACPGDAYGPTKDAVRAAGGYVAQADGPEGTLDAIRLIFAYVLSSGA